MTAILETTTADPHRRRMDGAISLDELVDAASDAYAGLRQDGVRVLARIQMALAMARWDGMPAGDERLVRLEWAWEALFGKLTRGGTST